MYRILSPTAILGYGFPKPSFAKAMELDIDLIAVDAGSMDAGPYYLGSDKQYVGKTALERDLQIIVKGALDQQCPLVIGSAGFSGASPQIEEVISIVKNAIEHENAKEVKVAIIRSDISFELLSPFMDTLTPLGKMPELDTSLVTKSKMVGQMGIEPIVAALEANAQIVICGRAYDPAVFAADPIRKGYPKGSALHAAKILECGAIACEPGSGSDCLIAELHMDGKAIFYPINPDRKATVRSISAHTLYEKSRPDIFHMPGGLLSIQNTSFFQVDDQKAGFSGSEFKSAPYSIKIEGSSSLGERAVSIVPLKTMENIDPEIRVYGRNGVEEAWCKNPTNEIGIITMVRSKKEHIAKDALSFLRSTILHYGYEGRISTAGNLAFPFSPSDILVEEEDSYLGIFIAGSRDPIFQEQWSNIKKFAMTALKEQHKTLYENCDVAFVIGNAQKPIAILEYTERTLAKAQTSNSEALESLSRNRDDERPAFVGIPLGQCYVWSMHHLIHDMHFIGKLFKIELEKYSGSTWSPLPSKAPYYEKVSLKNEQQATIDMNKNKIQEIADSTKRKRDLISITDLAHIIRSKNAGINELTFDILFKSKDGYQMAMRSNAFTNESISKTFQIPIDDIIGIYSYDPALAIKFTLSRNQLSGGPNERDVFGAQQHTRLLGLKIPRFN